METPSPSVPPVDVPRLLAGLAAEPQPRLTWVSRAGERVELSGRVLVNWVAKTAGLLVGECDLGPGGRLVSALGPSWRAPVLWLAAWHVGADVVAVGVPQEGGHLPDGDVVAVPDGSPVVPHGVQDVLVVAAGALAPRSSDPRVAGNGWVDYAAEVRLHPDSLPAGHSRPTAADRPAPRATGGGRRLLGPDAGPLDLLRVWAAGGSVVWHDGLDDDALARLAAQEHAAP